MYFISTFASDEFYIDDALTTTLTTTPTTPTTTPTTTTTTTTTTPTTTTSTTPTPPSTTTFTLNATPAERVSAGGSYGGYPPVWSFWHNLDDPDTPTIVKTNFKCIKEVYPDWQLIVMTKDNVDKYSPRDVIDAASNLQIMHKADLYRLYVLKEYGGLWIDSSVLIKDTNFVNELYKTCLEQNKIGLFEITQPTNTSGYPALENWFIMSPIPRHPVVELWYNEFLKAIKMGFKEYRRLISAKVNVKHIYKNSEYLTMHACIQYLIQTNPKLLEYMIIYKSEDSMFYIQEQCSWDIDKYRDGFIKFAKFLPCIKLRGGERDIMRDYNTYNYYYKY